MTTTEIDIINKGCHFYAAHSRSRMENILYTFKACNLHKLTSKKGKKI
jgi:hypothetical protein